MHADGTARDLFGSRIGRRELSHHRSRLIFERVERCQLFGDAEVEELYRAGRRHQDVGGLEVPVDDEVSVRVLHRLAHLAEQSYPLGDRGRVRVTVRRQGSALDVLHREPGRAIGERVRVEHLGDRRMIQMCQRLLFAREALPSLW